MLGTMMNGSRKELRWGLIERHFGSSINPQRWTPSAPNPLELTVAMVQTIVQEILQVVRLVGDCWGESIAFLFSWAVRPARLRE